MKGDCVLNETTYRFCAALNQSFQTCLGCFLTHMPNRVLFSSEDYCENQMRSLSCLLYNNDVNWLVSGFCFFFMWSRIYCGVHRNVFGDIEADLIGCYYKCC